MPSPYRKDDPRATDIQARFWSKVSIPEDDGCWEWVASLDGSGYGRFGYRGGLVSAHRFSFDLFSGPIPSGMHVLHHCDNPACVNPDHLYLGGPRDNMIDRELRGRGVAKLSIDDVKSIRLRSMRGETQASLSKEYGISDGHISEIIGRKKWDWVEDGIQNTSHN